MLMPVTFLSHFSLSVSDCAMWHIFWWEFFFQLSIHGVITMLLSDFKQDIGVVILFDFPSSAG